MSVEEYEPESFVVVGKGSPGALSLSPNDEEDVVEVETVSATHLVTESKMKMRKMEKLAPEIDTDTAATTATLSSSPAEAPSIPPPRTVFVPVFLGHKEAKLMESIEKNNDIVNHDIDDLKYIIRSYAHSVSLSLS